ncbi:hypothetical protein ACFL3P_02700 [Pseudomonadota bacterium]
MWEIFFQQSKLQGMDLFTAKKASLILLLLLISSSTVSSFADESAEVVLEDVVLEDVVDEAAVEVSDEVLEEVIDGKVVDEAKEVIEAADEISNEVVDEAVDEAVPVLLEPVFEMGAVEESPVAFKSLEQMDELVRLGLPALALRLLSQEQKNWPVYSQDWYAFERKRISLLSAVEDWQGVIDRTELLLKQAVSGQQITEQIAHWFQTQQVIARLRLGQAEQALAQLRNLLWRPSQTTTGPVTSEPVSSDLIALWRRLIIRSYLAMNADSDAQKSLLRYRHDYSSNHQNLNLDWRLLQARSLLRIDRAEEVIALLADSESHVAQALRLLAAVRVRPDHAELYAQEAQAYIADARLNKGEIWAYRYVVYQAYMMQKKLSEASQVLKNLIVQADAHVMLGEEFIIGGDDLWKLYETIGLQIGNQSKLLLGDDLAWYNRADESQETNIVEALSLYTVLAFNASDAEKQQMAHREIVALLAKDKNGLELVNQLYLHGTRVSSLESLPLEVRYSLIDYALSKGRMKLAVRLMKSVQQPPQGQDEFSWAMRKARVMILEGAYDDGEVVLANTLSSAEQLTASQLDHFLQVIFDLQAVHRHQQVLILLDSLKPEWMNENLHRELFFWKAESYLSLEQYDRAAWLYLKSAQLADQAEAHLWAQSARFKAAGALVKATLYDDAQEIYASLLQVTASESRKSAIRQELQQIRLLRSADKNPVKEKMAEQNQIQ